MTAQRNPTIATVKHHCGATADVRQASKGARKLYLFCPACGMLHYNLPAGQQWIKDNMQPINAGEKPDEKPIFEDAPAGSDEAGPAADQQDEPRPTKREPRPRGESIADMEL